MSRRRRPGRRLFKALLPLLAAPALGVAVGIFWIVSTVVAPARHPYLVTPATYFSARGLKITEEAWRNADGTEAHGWLLRGKEGAPAVALLHSYGADRSWLLNLGVKLSEATEFTVLWPDLRGHGENPPVATTSFGAREADDVQAALAFLRSLKTPQGRPLVGPSAGLYGVELGAYAALAASARADADPRVRALALDSVPASPDELLRAAVRERMGFTGGLVNWLARGGARLYLRGGYASTPACQLAARTTAARVQLLSGADAGYLRDSTLALAPCFNAGSSVEQRGDLSVTGVNVSSATGEQGETYDRIVIDFLDRALRD